MNYRNSAGYLTNETIDGMDSSMRTGVKWRFAPDQALQHEKSPLDYVLPNGLGVRCPDSPVNEKASENPWNFTRDQMMPIVAGLARLGTPEARKAVRKIFWACAKRLFLAQNFQRDLPGSYKYPWPHKYIDIDGKPQKKYFDFADPLFPVHISHMITAGKMWYFYPFHLIGWGMLLLQIYFPMKKESDEQNQIQCIAETAGSIFVRLYKKYNPLWLKQTYYYWNKRNEPEYAEWIKNRLESYPNL